MTILKGTRKRSIFGARSRKAARQFARAVLASLLAGLLLGGPLSPAFGQNQQQNPPATPAPQAAPVASLGVASRSYSRGPRAFPNILKPYEARHVEPPVLTNSPRLDQLIHDNKLEISLQDAIELALENNLDIAVRRYYPWISDAGLLNAAAGNTGFSTPGALIPASSTQPNPFSFFIQNFDPLIQSTTFVGEITQPINNPFISGTGGAAGLASVISHVAQYNNQYSQTFQTGTNITASWNNTRSRVSSDIANFFNPDVSSNLQVSLSQPLLNGFGKSQWTRNIRIANNNRRIADWDFAQQAITSIYNTTVAYWELVYARENVKVQQQTVAVAQKLYEDNKKQLEIGSLAPLDVTRSESEVATDTQVFIFAQTAQLQDEQTLKNLISKDPLAPNIINVEIIPTDEPKQVETVEAATFEDAIKEAFAKRPELQEQALNLKNSDIDVRVTKNALLPSLTATAFYESVGLAGNSSIIGAPTAAAGAAIVGANGAPIAVDVNGVPTPIFEPTAVVPILRTSQQGFTTAQSQVFHNRFPEYAGQLQLTLPLRNRSAQAVHARALLEQRQLETQMQQMKNAALLDVRNTYIALTQDRAQVAAASKARQLQQETFDAEQKRYQLGASTTYLVIQTQRDLNSAQGAELRALANLEEAKANYERAVGRTLEVNHVTIADAESGRGDHETLIPGTLNGKVVGTDELFKDLDLVKNGGQR
ncbi:MAG TPA: TolC family protein [Candidatus Methylomirabilis sp.]|nr:TolC family protein [Candidatus Methylomirabilis sp.]